MRYAVLSDIHSNLEALLAVLDACSGEKIDAYLCLGDVVGYAADPVACVRIIISLKPMSLIAGNHDWGVLGLTDIGYFNDYAREAILWTRGALGGEESEFLKSFKLTDEYEKFTLVHGSLEDPGEFNYILSENDARITMDLMKTPVTFVGHSHVAGVFYSSRGSARYTAERRVSIDENSRYVVNVGSIGQPRDNDPRSSFAIYDDREDVVEIRRVSYDIRACQKKILEAGLPGYLANRLSEGR